MVPEVAEASIFACDRVVDDSDPVSRGSRFFERVMRGVQRLERLLPDGLVQEVGYRLGDTQGAIQGHWMKNGPRHLFDRFGPQHLGKLLFDRVAFASSGPPAWRHEQGRPRRIRWRFAMRHHLGRFESNPRLIAQSEVGEPKQTRAG